MFVALRRAHNHACLGNRIMTPKTPIISLNTHFLTPYPHIPPITFPYIHVHFQAPTSPYNHPYLTPTFTSNTLTSYPERARLISERDYALEVQKVKNQMAVAAGKSIADVLLSSLMDPQQHPQLALARVPGEPVSEGVRAVATQALQDRLQRHIDEQVG